MSSGIQTHWKPVKCAPIASAYPVDNEEDPVSHKKPWLPLTLRKTYLGALILSTIGLIFVIQWLCHVSRRDQGIIFADNISELSLRRAFCYMYLPTIVSVTYSFLWTWVEQDVRRLEPYFQLSKDTGSKGRNSMLLNYPLEFIFNVPITAFRNRHWHVLSATSIAMLVFLGLTPTQAGIFAVRTVTVSESVRSLYSNAYSPINQQADTFGQYIQSVSNIAWLNETLPPFMTKDFILGAFGPSHESGVNGRNVTFTGDTYLYSVDISCETPLRWEPEPGYVYYNSSGGCDFYGPDVRPLGGNDTSKPFDSMYEGYSNVDGSADYYLSYYCNESFANYFFVRWTKSSPAAIRSGTFDDFTTFNETSLFCHPTFYRQKTQNATISLPSKAVVNEGFLGDKEALPNDLINITAFQELMSTGKGTGARTDYPTRNLPDQKGYLVNMPLNLAYIPQMAPFAIATTQQPLEWYQNAENLRLSYQSAYRLLFARELSEVLKRDLDTPSADMAHLFYVTQAVVVVPGFAHAATIFLIAIMILAIGIFATVSRRSNKITSSPATLKSSMVLVAGSSTIVALFSDLDGADSTQWEKAVERSHFRLERSADYWHEPRLLGDSVQSDHDRRPTATGSAPKSTSPKSDANASDKPGKGVRPTEMKLHVGIIFLMVQIIAAITFAVLWYEADLQNGLPLPSASTFVRQLVQHYIPIMLAALIEPFWLVLNKMLCLLLPFEQLRRGNATEERSVNLDYTSLPPQLVFWKALRVGHLILAVTCLMVLAANALAVALSGLMKEDTRYISIPTTFVPTKNAMFRQLNGTGPPFNSLTWNLFQGGTTYDQFYREMSNLTANTPLPAWTDNNYAYLPFDLESTNSSSLIHINTTAFGIEPNCQELDEDSYILTFFKEESQGSLLVPLDYGDGSVNCSVFGVGNWSSQQAWGLNILSGAQTGRTAIEIATMLADQNGAHDLFCRQHYVAGWVRAETEDGGENPDLSQKLNIVSQNETIVLCSPELRIGSAGIMVDSDGRVQRTISANTFALDTGSYFRSNPEDLIAQANQFLTDNGVTWHNDSFPSDWINYLIQKTTNDSVLLNASLPAPDGELAIRSLAPLYTKLFALLVGANIDLLLENATSAVETPGSVLSPEVRILLSKPAFVVVEVILICYIMATIMLYARRPWRILPRLPSTLASEIAFFAASRALRDLKEDRKRTSDNGQWIWSYGSFVGIDGRLHTGVERAPFVTLLDQKGQLSRRPAKIISH